MLQVHFSVFITLPLSFPMLSFSLLSPFCVPMSLPLPVSLSQSSRLACDSSVSAGDAEQLRSLCSRDPLYELSEQEKDFLWRHRWGAGLTKQT